MIAICSYICSIFTILKFSVFLWCSCIHSSSPLLHIWSPKNLNCCSLMASIPSLTNNVKRWIFTFGASQIWAKLPPLIWISSVAPENSLLSSTFLFATFWWHFKLIINHGPLEILYYWALCDWLTTIFWCHSYHGPGSPSGLRQLLDSFHRLLKRWEWGVMEAQAWG